MANNPVIRGFNAVSKFVARGFAQALQYGNKVKFCRIWTEPFTCQKISTKQTTCMKVSTS